MFAVILLTDTQTGLIT